MARTIERMSERMIETEKTLFFVFALRARLHLFIYSSLFPSDYRSSLLRTSLVAHLERRQFLENEIITQIFKNSLRPTDFLRSSPFFLFIALEMGFFLMFFFVCCAENDFLEIHIY